MGQVYSHLSEEERRIIRIEIGNGTSIRRIAGLIGRRASTVSRGIKRNTWFPSNENESYRPYRPERLKTGPWTGRCHIAGPAHRKAGRRRARTRKPYRLASDRLRAWPGAAYRSGHPSTRGPTGHSTVPGSASGRPTASSAWDATRTPRSKGARVSLWRASCPTRPPAKASECSSSCSPRCRPGPGPASRTTTAPSSPATRNCANGSAWPPTSPPRTRSAGAAATRTATARSAATCPNTRASTRPWPTRYRPSWTRPTTVPCACSATAPRPRHSPTNCYH